MVTHAISEKLEAYIILCGHGQIGAIYRAVTANKWMTLFLENSGFLAIMQCRPILGSKIPKKFIKVGKNYCKVERSGVEWRW